MAIARVNPGLIQQKGNSLAPLLSMAGTIAGTAIGGPLGGAAGGALGSALGGASLGQAAMQGGMAALGTDEASNAIGSMLGKETAKTAAANALKDPLAKATTPNIFQDKEKEEMMKKALAFGQGGVQYHADGGQAKHQGSLKTRDYLAMLSPLLAASQGNIGMLSPVAAIAGNGKVQDAFKALSPLGAMFLNQGGLVDKHNKG